MITRAILFGGTYLFLRTVGRLDRRAFPMIGAAAVLILPFVDSRQPFAWVDLVLSAAMLATGWLTGYVFSRVALSIGVRGQS